MTKSLYSQYITHVSDGEIHSDAAQICLVKRLDLLVEQLKEFQLSRKASALGWLFGKRITRSPQGLYIIGEVGRGKTMLMDMFYESVDIRLKRRVHFHRFMVDVHARIHEHRQQAAAGQDSIRYVADQLAREAWLLCFDEFQVTDIADAMMLGRLFERLFVNGVVVVATSNVHMNDLYKGGLNRVLFLPFIEQFRRGLDEFDLIAETDYRLLRLAGEPTWLIPLGPETDEHMAALFTRLAGAAPYKSVTLQVQGRALEISRTGNGVACFSFDDLCSKPLGSSDYLAIAEHFHTIVLEHVPLLSPEQRNETKRFIILVDAFYDMGVKLIVSAAAAPGELVQESQHAFEFQRTVSRLTEMQSEFWWRRPHGRGENMQDSGTGGLVET
jgi:cell division protein ZapE